MRNRLVILLLLFKSITFANEESLIENYMEELENVDDETFVDVEQMTDELTELLAHGIELNSVDESFLKKIPMLGQNAIKGILRHREFYSQFYSIYELKNCDGISTSELDFLKRYAYVGNRDSIKGDDSFNQIHASFTSFAGRIFPDKSGYKSDAKNPYLGNPWQTYLKLKVQAGTKMFMSFSMEEDAGERFFSTNDGITDYASASVELRDVKWFDKIIVGDFHVSFGQGLTIGGYNLGKSGCIDGDMFSYEGITRHSSTSEYGYYRGGGAMLSPVNKIQISLFGAHQKLDATLSDSSTINSIKSDGYHRTEAELAKRKNVERNMFGGNMKWKQKRWSIGATGLYYKYDHILTPNNQPYNILRTRNRGDNYDLSLDYKVKLRNIHLAGEFAKSADDGFAMVNHAQIHANSRLSFSLVQRHYTPEYNADFANAFGESSRNQNESGVFLGADLLPYRHIHLRGYIDVYRFDWLRYQVGEPCEGSDCMVMMDIGFKTNKKLTAKYRKHTKFQTDYSKHVFEKEMHSWRLTYKDESRTVVNYKTIVEANRLFDWGYVVAQDLTLSRRNKRANLSIRYAYFHTPDNQNRISMSEKDVTGYFSMPVFYGIGHHIGVSAQWKITPRLQFNAKYSGLIYTDGREKIGSQANEIIEGNKSTQLRFTMGYSL